MKISWTIILGILFVMPLWVSFDVYLTAEPLTSSNFKNAEQQTFTSVTPVQTVRVRSSFFKMPVKDCYFDFETNCILTKSDQ